MAIYNPSENISNYFDELYLVKFRRFGIGKKDAERKWYYFGSTPKIEKTSSNRFPYALFLKREPVNTPEDYLYKLNKIRIK